MEERDRDRNDPRNWPPIVQEIECWKALRAVYRQPRTPIPGPLVEDHISRKCGVEPDELTRAQIIPVVGDLISHYGAIKVVSSDDYARIVQKGTMADSNRWQHLLVYGEGLSEPRQKQVTH